MKRMRFLQLVPFLVLSLTSFGQEGNGPSFGNEFWMGYMNANNNSITLELFISGPTATTGTVDIPLQGWSQNFTVTPGAVTTVTVPTNLAHNVLDDIIEDRGVHIRADDALSVFAINQKDYSLDASKVLPIKTLGTKYLISTFQGVSGNGDEFKSEFLIVAVEDGTEIDITPSVNTAGGKPAGITYTINLDKGQSYQVKAASSSGDLTGSSIDATFESGSCRTFAVFAGAQCTFIPNDCYACDHIFGQLLPTPAWGNEYYIAPFRGTSGYTYSVMARDNGTSVSVDGGTPFLLNAGQSQFFNNVTTATAVSATGKIAVTQFMQGVECSNYGDPAML